MTKRISVVCAALIAGALVLIPGCSKKAEAPKEKVTLKFMFFSPELTDQYTDMAKAYEAETGVAVDVTVLQADYVTVLRAKLNSGDIPDVFMSSAYADNDTYKDYCVDLTAQDFIKEVLPTALTGVTLDGKIIGYPFLVQAHSFIYNKKLFADAGIAKLPTTLADYEDACRKLKAKGIQPFATGFKEWWVLPQTAWQVLAPVRDQYDGDFAKFVAKLNDGSLKFKDIKEMNNVFDVLDLIKKYGGNKPLESDFNDQCAQLANGKVAMIHQGNWAEDTIRKTNPTIDIGFLAGPVGSDGSKAGIMFDSNQTIRLGKGAKHEKEALAWMKWLTTSEYGKNWVSGKIKQLSPLKAAKGADAQLAKAATELVGAGVPSYPWYYQRFPTGTEQGMGIIFQGYLAGMTNRAKTLDALDAEYAKIAKAAK